MPQHTLQASKGTLSELVACMYTEALGLASKSQITLLQRAD